MKRKDQLLKKGRASALDPSAPTPAASGYTPLFNRSNTRTEIRLEVLKSPEVKPSKSSRRSFMSLPFGLMRF